MQKDDIIANDLQLNEGILQLERTFYEKVSDIVANVNIFDGVC